MSLIVEGVGGFPISDIASLEDGKAAVFFDDCFEVGRCK